MNWNSLIDSLFLQLLVVGLFDNLLSQYIECQYDYKLSFLIQSLKFQTILSRNWDMILDCFKTN